MGRDKLGRAAIVAPLYISVAWTLMVSYQFFTETAVKTVTANINTFWPLGSLWLTSRIDMIVFIYAFAWVFVLSSVIPSVILGKERSVLIQFILCLTITFASFIVQDILIAFGGRSIDRLFNLANLFHNPFLAVGYLLVPYLLMLALDIRSRKRQKKMERLEAVTANYLEAECIA